MGFEPTIPIFEQGKIFHVLGRAATVIGSYMHGGNTIFSCLNQLHGALKILINSRFMLQLQLTSHMFPHYPFKWETDRVPDSFPKCGRQKKSAPSLSTPDPYFTDSKETLTHHTCQISVDTELRKGAQATGFE
jgi:hypothetical protein